MKILLTGANGFLGREISQYYLNSKYQIIPTTRKELNPENYENVRTFFENNKIDVVIHTAAKGGKRGILDSKEDFITNIRMFQNLNNFSFKYKLMINFGSGAEFDRSQDISLINETEIFNRFPKDYYGLSKNLISRQITNQGKNNIFNLRLFGCFGEFEDEQRFLKNSFLRLRGGQNIEIHQDRYMDYIYVQDVLKVIDFLMHNQDCTIDRDINMCYDKKYLLSEIGNIFSLLATNEKSLNKSNIVIDSIGKDYTGNNNRLLKLGIDLVGLDKGIEKCLTRWNKYYN